jgi:hypothetical protein
MSTIPTSLPSLASALLDLSNQTAPAAQNTSAGANLTLPTDSSSAGTDTLDLSQTAAAQLQAAEAQIAQQNSASTLADSAAALTANNSAISFLGQDPTLAQAAQSSPSAAAVLSLL